MAVNNTHAVYKDKTPEEVRYKVVDKDCTPLQNVIDEIVGLYYTTIYKLKFLA